MNLIDLISYFRKEGNMNKFFEDHSLDPETEVVEIFMEKPLNIENQLQFFEIEKTAGKTEFEFNNVKYHNLTDFYFFQDFIEDSKIDRNQKFTDRELAEKLLHYCINDA